MALNTLLPVLDYNIDRRKISFEKRFSDKSEYFINSYVEVSLRNNFFLNSSIIDNNFHLKQKLKAIANLREDWNNMGSSTVSSEIIMNANRIISHLPQSVLTFLRPENIYPTKLGTIIMDWEIDSNNILSLEIAKKSVGYFIEVNGDDYKQVNYLSTENISLIVSSVTNDLSILL